MQMAVSVKPLPCEHEDPGVELWNPHKMPAVGAITPALLKWEAGSGGAPEAVGL